VRPRVRASQVPVIVQTFWCRLRWFRGRQAAALADSSALLNDASRPSVHTHTATSWCAVCQENQVAAELSAKGRIAAVTYRVTLPHDWYSLYLTTGWEIHTRFLPSYHPSSQPKRHIDWFSRFCTDNVCDQHMHGPRYICSNRPDLYTVCMQCGLKYTYTCIPIFKHCRLILLAGRMNCTHNS